MALQGDRVKKLRQERQITQEELASRANISLRLLQRYEKTETDPSIDIAARIAKALETTLDYLAGIDNDPDPQLIEMDLSNEELDLILAIRRRNTNRAIQSFAALTKDTN